MGNEPNVERIVFGIVTVLVDSPEQVSVSAVTTANGTVFVVSIESNDIGKVIGKQGRNAKAIRELLLCIGTAANKRYGLDVITKT